MERIPVVVLGATGMVGQRIIERLQGHPWFRVGALAASERSAGRPYREAAAWRLDGDVPAEVAEMTVLPCRPDAMPQGFCLALSALDSSAAITVERDFRAAGYAVVSNASSYRRDPTVPLVIPEVNPEHLDLVRLQGGPGFIVTNPNCVAIPLSLVLAPLHRAFRVEAVAVATWQAVSGAGYPGESAWDMAGNVHPHSDPKEEEKIAWEPRKILGSAEESAEIRISARCVRVPVADGHLVSAQIRMAADPSPAQVTECLRDFRPGIPPIPSSPSPLFHIYARNDRPSPRMDSSAGGGMAVSVGRIDRCDVMGIKLFCLAHNAIRGAAGAALANLELLRARDLLPVK